MSLDFAPCRICASPYRRQLEDAFNSKVPKMQIAKKYIQYIKYSNLETFRKALYNHMTNPHYALAQKRLPYVPGPSDSPQNLSPASLDALADGLLEIGMNIVTHYKNNPEAAIGAVKLGDVIKAQDAVSRRKLVENQKDMLKIAMAKMFSGFIPPTIEEGELVDTQSPIPLQPES